MAMSDKQVSTKNSAASKGQAKHQHPHLLRQHGTAECTWCRCFNRHGSCLQGRAGTCVKVDQAGWQAAAAEAAEDERQPLRRRQWNMALLPSPFKRTERPKGVLASRAPRDPAAAGFPAHSLCFCAALHSWWAARATAGDLAFSPHSRRLPATGVPAQRIQMRLGTRYVFAGTAPRRKEHMASPTAVARGAAQLASMFEV